jgi:cardiolipin synthase
LYISKINTLLQILLVAASLLQGGYGIGLAWLMTMLIWSVALTTLASGAAYVWNTARGE